VKNNLTWNYRVIVNDLRHTPWMDIYTVYYHNGKPIDHSVSMATPSGDHIADITEGLAKMRSALDKPILKISEFPLADDHRRKEWICVGNAEAEWVD